MTDWAARFTRSNPLAIALLIVVATGIVLLVMGRVPVCTCGSIKFWHGVVKSSENSQHIADWYTFSHILHGYLFYALLWWLAPNWSIAQRLAAAVAIEAGWEILENSPLIIERYRAATISLDYYGDSILNSLSDIAAMVIGFALAAVLPVGVTVALAVVSEAGMAYVIRDNLALNVIMLIHPLDAVRAWQEAGGG
jgi:Protein of unknown function (DUF2585)